MVFTDLLHEDGPAQGREAVNKEQQELAVQLASRKIRPEAIASTLTRRYGKVFTAVQV